VPLLRGGSRADIPTHASGTDRVAEVARGLSNDVIVNVQGDEPLIEHGDLRTILGLLEAKTGTTTEHRGIPDVVMATLVVPRTDPEGFLDPNIVKAVVAQDWARSLLSAARPCRTPRSPAARLRAAPARGRWSGSSTWGSTRIAGVPPRAHGAASHPSREEREARATSGLEHGYRTQGGKGGTPARGDRHEGRIRRIRQGISREESEGSRWGSSPGVSAFERK